MERGEPFIAVDRLAADLATETRRLSLPSIAVDHQQGSALVYLRSSGGAKLVEFLPQLRHTTMLGGPVHSPSELHCRFYSDPEEQTEETSRATAHVIARAVLGESRMAYARWLPLEREWKLPEFVQFRSPASSRAGTHVLSELAVKHVVEAYKGVYRAPLVVPNR